MIVLVYYVPGVFVQMLKTLSKTNVKDEHNVKDQQKVKPSIFLTCQASRWGGGEVSQSYLQNTQTIKMIFLTENGNGLQS